jgi:hypothetical protein
MTVSIGNYQFEGPSSSTGPLEDRDGIYAVLTQAGPGEFSIVDTGESEMVRSRVENHDRSDCWRRNASRDGRLVAVLYTPHVQQSGRVVFEGALRRQYQPACGIR